MQKMNGNNKTFEHLAKSVMSLVLHDGSQSHRIDMVFNVYRETSIKNAERCIWGSSTAIQFSTGTLQEPTYPDVQEVPVKLLQIQSDQIHT